MKKPLTNNLTLVFTIKDHDAFEPERKRLMDMFEKLDDKPYAITAISLGHEIHRLELIEACLGEDRADLADVAFGLIDPTECKDIEDLEARL